MSYTVAVRALCEFTAKCGDLDLRFTPSPSAQDGIAGHSTVRSRRKPGYRSEVSLTGSFQELRVRGRADGYDPALNQVEEIKTFRGALDAMPANHRQLHWAQAKIYGHLLCQHLALTEIHVALVYYDIDQQTETEFSEAYSAAQLQSFFDEQCSRFLAWAQQEARHIAARNHAARALSFPHASFRSGQRELAAAVYKSSAAACCLMAQAPTGIGKTIGTLFPLLKASPEQQLDKIFCLTAKTSGRRLALDAAALIKASAPELPLRVLELVARDKACEHPEKACHGESCPLAKGFYDRLPQARSAMLNAAAFDRAAVRTTALEHGICPYYLGQEMAQWADVVVGDYNYYFDTSAMLYGATIDNQWRVGILVDEAHNLIERARKMYSAELDQANMNMLRVDAAPELKGPLDRLNRSWNALHKEQGVAYQVQATLPDAFLRALQRASDAIALYFAENPATGNPRLQQFYFDALHFSRMAEAFGEHSLFDITKTLPTSGTKARSNAVLSIRNIIPAPFLAPRFEASHSTTLFSATLSPPRFYSDMLGLPENTRRAEVQSPFRAAQLTVKLVPSISTRYRDRDASLAPIVALIARQVSEQPGNYLAFFSSFDYLQKVHALFEARHPHIPTWAQGRRMEEAQREEFLARFTETGEGIGFAVLGGAFAEGIDLPGNRLIGAFIATLGLPQINPLNEQIRMRMQARFGTGYEYAYLFPGLQKVVQAAGRVIRTAADRGTVFLIDDRFSRPEVRQLLPDWWKVEIEYAAKGPTR